MYALKGLNRRFYCLVVINCLVRCTEVQVAIVISFLPPSSQRWSFLVYHPSANRCSNFLLLNSNSSVIPSIGSGSVCLRRIGARWRFACYIGALIPFSSSYQKPLNTIVLHTLRNHHLLVLYHECAQRQHVR